MALSKEYQELCLAMGFIVLKWAEIDCHLDFATSTIYTDCGGNKLKPRMPKFLKDKNKFIIQAIQTIPELKPFREKGMDITSRIAANKDRRDDFVHSVITAGPPQEEKWIFVRFDAKEHNHGMAVWGFDLSEFPALIETLQGLAADTQAFAKSLEVTFHK